MKKYDHSKTEKKWQKEWQSKKVYKTERNSKKEKFYVLDMFPYPSGEGLHVGHPKGYIATDVVSRMKRMQGFNVLHPMGFDAFGLPAENYALKTKTNPEIAVKKNVARYKKQLEIIGFDYDWSREVNTTDPKFYKWTQWIFLKLLEKGLAYESFEPINWCPSCKTGLANEDVEDGKCERCGTPVEKKPMRQWVLKITDYADRLLRDLDIKILPNGDHFEITPNGEPHIIHMNTDVPGKVRVDKPFVPREAVCVFVEHWEGGKFIALKWKKVAWLTPITGGVEKGQTPEEAARAEVMEETGFKNLTLVSRSKGQYHSTFFHVPKDENRVGHFTSFHFKLKNGERSEILAEENEKHEVTWLPRDKFRDMMTAEAVKLGWDLVMSGKVLHEAQPLLNWPESIKEAQRNWIGRSEGMVFESPVKGTDLKIKTFSAHFEAFAADTFVVIAPDHPFLPELVKGTPNEKAVLQFAKVLVNERNVAGYDAAGKEPNGIFTGRYTVDPVGNGELPIWVASYALADYGTGIVKCSCHDERDFAFAKKYGIKMKPVLFPADPEQKRAVENLEVCFTDMKEGILIEPKEFKGKKASDSREGIIAYLEKNNLAHKKTTYRLKDWVFSRQRYWGEPIPVLHDEGKIVPVSPKDLPVKLPKVKSYEPTGTGESPLAGIDKWVNVKIGKGKDAKVLKRETNTMPQWAGSSWYYLRYMDPQNDAALVDKNAEAYWNMVDFYVGGAEHATRHLIYARFWHKFLYDIGAVTTIEPFKKLQSVGLIMGEDGRKMSKRFGNVVNPDTIVETYGADTMRVYEMFMGPFDQAIAWSTSGMIGTRRFLERVWKLREKVKKGAVLSKEADVLLHKTIKKVSDDMANLRHNTAVSSLMILSNELDKSEALPKETYEAFLKLLAPLAPHITEELWRDLGNKKSIHVSSWPVADEAKMAEEEATIVVQVNGKVRGSFAAPKSATKEELEKTALSLDDVKKWMGGKKPQKVIVVPGRLVSIVL